MQISESKGRYLEAIYRLTLSRGYVMSVDIARYLNYSKPSVSIAMKNLLQLGLIEDGPGNGIYLSEQGKQLAGQLHERFDFFYQMLLHKGMKKELAEDDAYRLMQAISEEGFRKIKLCDLH